MALNKTVEKIYNSGEYFLNQLKKGVYLEDLEDDGELYEESDYNLINVNILAYNTNGNFKFPLFGQCHSVVDDIGNPFSGYLLHLSFGDGSEPYDQYDWTWATKEQRRRYIDFIINRSPFSHYLVCKDLDLCEKVGLLFKADVPSKVFSACGMSLRHLWENRDRFEVWEEAVDSGYFTEWEALCVSQILPEDYNNNHGTFLFYCREIYNFREAFTMDIKEKFPNPGEAFTNRACVWSIFKENYDNTTYINLHNLDTMKEINKKIRSIV
jgi:hypothetical protein